MATFTITTDQNFDAQVGKAGGDTYNINGAVLTIDGDSRYDNNCTPTTGSPLNITISATLGGELKIDGSAVRLIPYDGGGATTVPAKGITITQAGQTGTGILIGVWSALNVAPLAAGAAMPATGWIKVKQVTGTYAAGALTGTGLTANATGPDIVGWIEISCDEGGLLTISRLGKLTTRGAWFALGASTATRGQTMTLPTSGGTAFWIPGVWVETGNGTNVYEFWPCLTVDTGGGWTSANQGTQAFNKFVQCDGSLIRIGEDAGGTDIGALPANGARIIVPNVFLHNNTTAAKGATAKPNVAPGSRFETLTSGAGVIDMQITSCCWYINLLQAYLVDLVNVSVADAMLVQECAGPVNWNGGGTGITNPMDLPALTFTTNLAGGTLQNLRIGRAGTIGSGDHSAVATYSKGQTWSNVFFYQGTLRTNNTLGYALAMSWCSNQTFTDCTFCPSCTLVTCSNITATNTVTIDRMASTTLTTYPTSCFVIATKCSDILIDGISQGGYSNVQPYTSLVALTASTRIRVRNIGTPTSRLVLNGTNPSRYIFTTGGNNDTISLQRIYTSGAATACGTYSNSDKNVLVENVWGDAADRIVGSGTVDNALNCVVKGCYAESGTVLAAFTSVYGTHFWDTFVSATAGRQGIVMNEPTAETAAQVVTTGTANFTSSGTLYAPTSGDTCTWTWPHYVLGCTGFLGEPTLTGGTNVRDRVKFEYQIDPGTGTYGSLRTLLYARTATGGVGGEFTITMADTTGVNVDDYVFGTNVGADAKVTIINNGTTITVDVANTGTVSGVLRFSYLRNEVVSATTGYKLKVILTVLSTSTSNTITGLYWPTVTDASSQQTQYPLDLVTVIVTCSDDAGRAIPYARVRVEKTSDGTPISSGLADANGVYTDTAVSYTASVNVNVIARLKGYQNYSGIAEITAAGLNVPATMAIDEVINLP